ncbi:MAG: BACON domain-containing carbohydrate-binding protein [Cytophagales bacterium]|nr:BACON domain-containing carbohydrate-binding protein [Cytophagales bacterium]
MTTKTTLIFVLLSMHFIAHSQSDFFPLIRDVDPKKGEPGEEISLESRQYYDGSSTSTLEVQMAYYLSNDLIWDNGDKYLGKSTSTLSVNDQYDDENYEFTVPDDLRAGNWYILFVADYNDRYSESREDNNISAASFEIEGINDVRTSDEEISPTTTYPGSTVKATCEHKYEGNLNRSDLPDISLGFYLSTDDDYDENDLLLGELDSGLGLDDKKDNEELNLTIPSDTPPGKYYIIFYSDYKKQVEETSETNNIDDVEINILPIPELNVSPTFIQAASSGETRAISLNSNVSWTAASNVSWISIDPSSGTSGSQNILLNIAENSETTDRSAELTFIGGGLTRKVILQQSAPELDISPSNIQVSSSSGIQTLSLTSNIAWTASTNISWLSIDPSSGSSGYQNISLNISENIETTDRSAELTFIGGGLSRKVTVQQSAFEPELEVSPATIEASSSGGTETIVVSSNLSWTASTSVSWISIDPSSGSSGDQNISLNISENSETTDRSAELTITGGDLTQIVTIQQSAFEPELKVSPTTLEVSSSGGTETIVVTSNLSWAASANVSWISINPSSGSSGDQNISLNISENSETTDRSAELTITGGDLTQIVTIQQSAFEPELKVSPTTLEVSSSGGTETIVVTSNLSWAASANVSWISINPSSGSSGDQNISLNISENSETTDRSAELTFTGGDLTQIVTIQQSAFAPELSISPSSLTFSQSGGTESFDITSNVSWTLNHDNEWLTISETSGTGNQSIEVTAESNPDENERQGTITISGDGLSSSLSIDQAGMTTIPEISVDPETLNFEATSSSQTFEITSNVNWEISSSDSWATFTPDSGMGNETISVTVSDNSTNSSRQATLSITGSGISTTVQVEQEPTPESGFITIDPSSIEVTYEEGSESVDLSSNISWSIEADSNWLTVSPTEGTENEVITISFTENELSENRTAVIQINGSDSGSDINETLTFTQLPNPTLTVNPTHLNFDSKGGTGQFDINTNISWNIDVNFTWISISPSTGTGDQTVTATIDQNDNEDSRSGVVTVYGGIEPIEITVSQEAKPYLEIDKEQLAFDAEAQSGTFTINSNLNWMIENDIDWVSFSAHEGSGTQTINIDIEENKGFKERSEMIEVTGDGLEDPVELLITQERPEQIEIGSLTISAETVKEDGDILMLSGDVKVNDFLNLDGEVSIDTKNLSISGNGEIFLENIPRVGHYGGEIKLYEGAYQFSVQENILDSEKFLNKINDGLYMAGIPLQIGSITLQASAVSIDGIVDLPDNIFGEDSEIFFEEINISKSKGLQVTGALSINPALRLYKTLTLESAFFNFNTSENCFEGGGVLGFNMLKNGITLDAAVTIKQGKLNSVFVEIEATPGIPLGTTGFSLAGGNASLENLQSTPIRLSLGVDIIPTAQGNFDIVRLDNMTVTYTFKTELIGYGTIQLFGKDVASGSITVQPGLINAEGMINLLDILIGQSDFSIQRINEKYHVSGQSRLIIQIPKSKDFPLNLVYKKAPYELGRFDTYLDNTCFCARVRIVKIPVNACITYENGKIKSDFTKGFESKNGSIFSTKSRIAGSHQLENDLDAQRKNRLEGRSIIFTPPPGRTNDFVEYSFTLDEDVQNLFIRVEDLEDIPNFQLELPNGQIIDQDNAEDFDITYTVYEEGNQAYYIISNPITGDFKLYLERITHEIDVIVQRFGASLEIEEIEKNPERKEIKIKWRDEDPDSNAEVSWYYDMDAEGADGLLIEGPIFEDDEADSISWNTESVPPGAYYIYGVIKDSDNTPIAKYAEEPILIENNSSLEAPQISATLTEEENLMLEWDTVENALGYYVYVGQPTLDNILIDYNVGDTTSVLLQDLTPGRSYEMAVTAYDLNLEESSYSNIHELALISSIVNNPPSISLIFSPENIRLGQAYRAIIQTYDPDADSLTYRLKHAPPGMEVTSDSIHWTPSAPGGYSFQLFVEDGNDGVDSISLFFSVYDSELSEASLSFNKNIYLQSELSGSIFLSDPDLNTDTNLPDSYSLKLYSNSDPEGINILMTEDAPNSAFFNGEFHLAVGSNESNTQLAVSYYDSLFAEYFDTYPEERVLAKAIFDNQPAYNHFPTGIELIKQLEILVDDQLEVGWILVNDPDVADEHSIELVPGEGDDHNSRFEIRGDTLLTIGNYQDLIDQELSIRINVNDQRGGTYENTLSFQLNSISLVLSSPYLNSSFKIYPNPVTESLKLNIPITMKKSFNIRLYDPEVQLIFDKEYRQKERISIDVHHLAKGIYYIQVSSGDRQIIRRFIKDH